MNVFVEAALLEQQRAEPSALARARVQRQLTVDEAARRSGLTEEEVVWIEDGRLYRFGSSDQATLGLLLYATALDISRREARRLAGLPLVELAVADPSDLDAVGRHLFDRGIYVTLAPYPVVPRQEAGFRIQLTAAHTTDQVDHLLNVLQEVNDRWGFRRPHP